jgi:hypothetical protein
VKERVRKGGWGWRGEGGRGGRVGKEREGGREIIQVLLCEQFPQGGGLLLFKYCPPY